jgi:abortive infection bacteriophage resistance protein
MDSFRKQKKYYIDSPIIKHHSKVYKNKLPLWVIVEFLSFSNTSKLYNSMLRSDKLAIAKAVNSGPSLLTNNLHCMSILRNKCAHAARLYNITFSLPAKFPKSFLKRNLNLKNNTLFAYLIVLLRRLPCKSNQINFISELSQIIRDYKNDIELPLLGFPTDYLTILKHELNNTYS